MNTSEFPVIVVEIRSCIVTDVTSSEHGLSVIVVDHDSGREPNAVWNGLPVFAGQMGVDTVDHEICTELAVALGLDTVVRWAAAGACAGRYWSASLPSAPGDAHFQWARQPDPSAPGRACTPHMTASDGASTLRG
ncbi:hypothetical protein [Deinococcus marmoris]|uniref:hypothetical protein n=1 Tax=Deinococcus marmoris TaxID=249408 RepID=UPI00096A3948|nr:hypothetical protein [Deinococcus marmoris]